VGRPLGRGGHLVDDAADRGLVTMTHVHPQVDGCRDHVGAARGDLDAADGAAGVVDHERVGPQGAHGLRGHDDRILSIGHPGGAGVVSTSLDAHVPTAVGDDRPRERERLTQVLEAPALLDVQLDEGGEPGEAHGVGPDQSRIESGIPRRLGEGDPAVVAQLTHPLRVDESGEQPCSETGDAETGALLLGERRDHERSRRPHAPLAEHVDGGERAGDAERPVEVAAAWDGVEMRARRDRIDAARVWSIPPGPDDSVAVDVDVEPASIRLLDEPGPQREFGCREHGSRVSAALRVDADVSDLLEELDGAAAHRSAPAKR
jgi:hypothetical protein